MHFPNSVGYYKDLIALGAFIIVLVVATIKTSIPKFLIITGLLFCIVIDGAFTLSPSWHCESVGKNPATFMLLVQCIMVVSIACLAILKI